MATGSATVDNYCDHAYAIEHMRACKLREVCWGMCDGDVWQKNICMHALNHVVSSIAINCLGPSGQARCSWCL